MVVYHRYRQKRKCGWCGHFHNGPCGKVVQPGARGSTREVNDRGRGNGKGRRGGGAEKDEGRVDPRGNGVANLILGFDGDGEGAPGKEG